MKFIFTFSVSIQRRAEQDVSCLPQAFSPWPKALQTVLPFFHSLSFFSSFAHFSDVNCFLASLFSALLSVLLWVKRAAEELCACLSRRFSSQKEETLRNKSRRRGVMCVWNQSRGIAKGIDEALASEEENFVWIILAPTPDYVIVFLPFRPRFSAFVVPLCNDVCPKVVKWSETRRRR